MKSLRKIFALLLCLSLCLKFAPSIHADSERSFQNNSEEVIIDHNTSGLFSPRTGGVSSSFLNECSSSYKSGPYYSKLANLSLSGNPASDLILVAYSQIGYHEGNSWDEISGTYNGCSDYTEYNRWYPVQAQWWCNLFVSWCFRAAGIGDDIAPKNPFYLSQWRSRGAGVYSWGDYKNGFITPQPGDIIIYGPDSSDVDGSSLEDSYQHIGIVYSYQNGTFFNIEGNYSDAVTFVDHTPDYYSGWSGTGFIHAIVRPNYGPITYLDKCNVYPTNITVKTNVNVNLKSLPCSQDTDPNSTTLTQIPSGKSFTVTELYRNDYDHYDKCWYKVSYNGKEGYIYSGHTVVTEYGDNTVSVSGGTSAPTTLPENQGYFATWLINSNHLWIDTVRGYIFDRNTGAVIPGYPSEKTGIRAMSYQLGSENRNEPVDAGLHFSTLSPGDYFCIIEVTTHCYYGASDGSLQTKATKYHPIDFSFKKEGSANLSSGAGRPIPDGTYIIASYADPQYYIDIEGSGYPAENGANVGLWGPRDGTLPEYDTWTVTYINDGNGFYFITQPNTEMALSACGSTTKSGDNIAVYPFRQLDAQKWSIVQNENGSYSIRAKCSGNCIDISGKISETCNIQQWEANYGVYQQWIFIPNGDLESYTVSYNANGGTDAPANQVKLYNIDLILSSDQPKRADTSAESFIVTLDANDGSGSSTSLTAERTTKYTFKNWKANDSDRSYGAGDIYKTNAPVTLNAQWNNSTTTAAVTLPTPTRDDHVFLGWGTSSTASSGVTGSYTPSGNITLYAIWRQNNHTVTYDANGGTGAPDPQIKVHGEALTLSDTIPNRDGYVFLGWAADQTATEAEYQPSDSFTTDADTTLYAVWEYDVVASGVWGDLDWVIGRDGTLTISGSGPMDTGAYLGSDNWTDHKNLFTKVVIQEGVTSVGNLAFTMGFNITQVSLPDSLTRIGAGAFLSCKNLTEIVIPEHVTSIDQDAFGGSGLTKVVIPASVVSIGEQAFLDNILDSVTFEGHAPEIGENAFKNVEATVYFPADDVSWSESMRQNYKGTLSWVAYTADGHRYGAPDWSWANDYESASATFTYLDNNGTQTLTETVTSTQIEPSCTVDGDLVYTASVTFNGQNYTDRRSVAQPDFVLPDALTEIGEEAFANCGFTYVKLPENTDTIGKNAFANCPNLKYIYIPKNCLWIDRYAFTGVTGLTILGVDSSYAQTYASGKGFDFIAVP